MDALVAQITSLSSQESYKELADYLRQQPQQATLKGNAAQIDEALQSLDPTQHTLGITFMLVAQFNAEAFGSEKGTFNYICNFLQVAQENQVKKVVNSFTFLCKSFAQMAINNGQQAMLRSLIPLRCALQLLQPNPETLTPIHSEFIRVCLKSKAYHLAERVLDQPIFDIAHSNSGGGGSSSSSSGHMTPQSFLSYFYYGAMVRIGTREYTKALQLLLVCLTCPSTCLSAIQVDAYKKYVLISLKAHGELKPLPSYSPQILQRFAKSTSVSLSYVLEITEAFKKKDPAALDRILQDKLAAIQADQNVGLVKQVISSLLRHKVQTLTKTYLILSLSEIAEKVGLTGDGHPNPLQEAEALLFDMISNGEINARIDHSTGENPMVSFEDEEDQMDVAMVAKMQAKLSEILTLSSRIGAFESEVVTSEGYIRKTAQLVEGDRSGAAMYDFMDVGVRF
eukprot:TRINITY_DN21563_c0_g1_i1.p1 TRINITY_DN21563_c0_g1~~TRINITY_DN21563_c0_g1_i1.p1  ORF type:complete len:453 (-),score=103.65 TRINITY_DN21563_c0_g1_i1:96-1454(-)